MKKTYAVILAITTIVLAACSGNNDEQKRSMLVNFTRPVKTDIVGALSDGTTMNNVEVVDANGDTTSIEIGNNRFFGNKTTGDSVVIAYIEIDNQLISSTIVNINDLQHTWTIKSTAEGKEQYMELDPKGFVHLFEGKKEDRRFEKWKVDDGKIILLPPSDSFNSVMPDTLDIIDLSDDSLTVKKHDETIKFWRYN